MGLISDHVLSPQAFLDECLGFKREQRVRSRYMQELLIGKLDRARIALWAKDFYYYVEPAIPSIAAWLASAPTLPDRDLHQLVARNLAGEMGYIKEAEHHDLYLQFCDKGLGISRQELLDFLPLPTTIGAASVVGHYCRSSFIEGLGAFGLAVELELPEMPGAGKILYDALKTHYQISEAALEFFYVHIEAEEEHGENARRALELCAQTREQQALIRRAYRFSVLAHNGMREGYDRLLTAPTS